MNSSSWLCQCRCDDAVPAGSRTRLTPKFFRPTASPSARFSRAATGLLNGGQQDCDQKGDDPEYDDHFDQCEAAASIAHRINSD